jgi:leucyl-tRNA---protein transferase
MVEDAFPQPATAASDLHEKALSRSFYATQPAPCPYLAGRIEQRIVTPFFAGDDAGFFDSLNQAGFRRSHGFLYRPACPGCQACVPVRVPVTRFAWTRRFRKVWKRNRDIRVERRPAKATDEQYALFKRYLDARHDDGGMARMTREDYRELVENAPADTFVAEFRLDDELIAAALSDELLSGLSGVYKFFAPELERRSLGSFVILWYIEEAVRLGLPFVYLGYWIERSRKMRYKAMFQPMEQLGPNGWCPLPPLPPDMADA